MDKFTKEELDKIGLLLKSDDRTNYIIAFNLLRIHWKLSEVKRYVVKWFLINVAEDRRHIRNMKYDYVHQTWIDNNEKINQKGDAFIRTVMLGKRWGVGWYATPIIKELYLFEVEGVKHFLLNGKYKNM